VRKLREWKWSILKPYNGFSNVERIHVWQLQSWFTDNGWWEKPTVCAISGRTDHVAWHSENYYDWPHSSFPVQQGIHLALHNRFKNSKTWLGIVSQYAVKGDEWFARLSLEPIDLAAQLRAEHGPEIADLFARAPFPEGTSIPRHQIYQEE